MNIYVSRTDALRRLREQDYCIYVLIDPRDQRPRYIGRSRDPAARLRAHVRGGGHGIARRAWLAELHQLGLSPSLEVLERPRGVVATIRAEQRWVDLGRQLGWPLVNRKGGARGGVWSLGCRSYARHWQPRDFERELRRAGL